MAERMLRRGLPRVAGGEAWPPAGIAVEVADAPGDAAGSSAGVAVSGAVVSGAAASGAAASDVAASAGTASVPGPADAVSVTAAATASSASAPPADGTAVPAAQADSSAPAAPSASAGLGSAVSAGAPAALRRGLPRVTGGEPWPPAGVVSAAASPAVSSEAAGAPVGAAADREATGSVPATAGSTPDAGAVSAAVAADAPVVAGSAPSAAAGRGPALRRGLPRVAGGEPWPPAGTVAATATDAAPAPAPAEPTAAPAAASPVPAGPVPASPAASAPAAPPVATPSGVPLSVPLPFPRTVWPGTAPRRLAASPARPEAAETPGRRLRPTWPQAIAGLFAAAGLGIVAGAAIAFVRAFLTLPFMQDFLVAFPGEYHSPANPAPGFPAWIGWQHFFNVFLMVLIIRSGLRVRTEKRPTVFWTPRRNPKGKISLTLWFHQALDVLWLVNGVVFVVLLFVTGHWARIVPTSWEVFPNALSAALQYVSFDWPTENGWVNYNSLQQLAYFATVFLAAPLAAVTGFRMSGMWPKRAERLSKAYPVEWARAVHFPVMLYFVGFIVVHVALVMLTGFLRNLNHMYASQDAVTWTGFWVFVGSLVVIAAAWVADRPLVLAPIARAFGNVSGR